MSTFAASEEPPFVSKTARAPSARFCVAVKGGALIGELRGSGPPVVFVHGMGGSRKDWVRLVGAMADNEATRSYSTTAYDLRGFGESSAEKGVPFSHAEDLRALMDKRGLATASLVGLSMGGAIALNFALNHPERVSHLILISPAMIGWQWSAAWKAIWANVAKAARAGDVELARKRWLDHPMFDAVRNSAAGDELRQAIEAYHGRQWISDDQRHELPDIERLHELQMPTLLLTGGLDVEDMRLIGSVIDAASPQVTRIDFADAGHMLALERPADVARAIGSFLQN